MKTWFASWIWVLAAATGCGASGDRANGAGAGNTAREPAREKIDIAKVDCPLYLQSNAVELRNMVRDECLAIESPTDRKKSSACEVHEITEACMAAVATRAAH